MDWREDVDEEKTMKEPLLNHSFKRLGGFRTVPFVLATEGLERAAYCGLMPNMIVYLMGVYGLDLASGSNIIFLWSTAANLTPLLGAALADSWTGRFRMIVFGCVLNVLGMMLFWSTTIIPGIRPSYEETLTTSATPFQLLYLCTSLALISFGSGGIKSSAVAFGADQLRNMEDKDNDNQIAKPIDNDTTDSKAAALEKYFNWYYFCVTCAMLLATTCLVYVQDHSGWRVGFAIPVALMLLATVSFFMASSFYAKMKPTSSLFTGFAQVIVASWRNRHMKVPSHVTGERVYHTTQESLRHVPSEQLRCLNKACIVRDVHTQDETTQLDPWTICTVDQVEDLKKVINIIPLWSTGIIMNVTGFQSSLIVVQAESMNRQVFNLNIEIPAGSFLTFGITRMGIGVALACTCMVVAAVVESVRLSMALSSTRKDVVMSALWLVPQICLMGLAEGLTAVAQIEFFYSVLPKSMSSIASSLYGLSVSVASLVASLIMSVVDNVTKQGGKDSWVSSDPNKGHYDYYYWVLAGFSLLNFMYFVVCCRAYGNGEVIKVSNDKLEKS